MQTETLSFEYFPNTAVVGLARQDQIADLATQSLLSNPSSPQWLIAPLRAS
jgi:hypothetical protein